MTELLPADLQQYVHEAVTGGRYRDEAQLMTRAVQLLREHDAEYERFRSELRERAAGMERGEYHEVEVSELGKYFDDLVAEVDREMAVPPSNGVMSRPKIHDLARRDLKDIYRYIAADNRPAARRVVARLREVFDLLATQPLMGELRSDLLANTRQFTFGNYVILFRPFRNTVEILQVVHGARDLKAAFHTPEK